MSSYTNLEAQGVISKSSKLPSYTEELIERLQTLTNQLQESSREISQNLERLVGQDDIMFENDAKESKSYTEGLYGALHSIMDELELAVRVNKDNTTKLNRIV